MPALTHIRHFRFEIPVAPRVRARWVGRNPRSLSANFSHAALHLLRCRATFKLRSWFIGSVGSRQLVL
jgi:hypothetical protein